ncbi:MAG TPA: thiamine pyrophosphate-dependent enzyme [Myxococcota bacterium]|nr:thiamine pyrophosphate-dependent enzyme [Myxococcota bacterium]
MHCEEKGGVLGSVPFPYCAGCGHTLITRALATALERTGLPHTDLCVVSDIGCVGLVDRLLPSVHTVHTTHGRSTAFATGISVTDGVLNDGRLRTVVVIGDGGATIGLLHLLAAAQLNVDVTVVLHNNHLYGMTGGQASGLSPDDWVSPTTPAGNPLPPMDILGMLRAAGATFLAREIATDKALPDRILEAIEHPGFAVVEVLELCTAFSVKWNAMNARKLREIAAATGEPLGIGTHRTDRTTYRRALQGRAQGAPKSGPASAASPPEHDLVGSLSLVIAGTAGERVQTTVRTTATLAVEAGLYATQKNDNLVTQGTGHSISELILSADPIHYTGIVSPDCVIAVSVDGIAKLAGRGTLASLRPDSLLVVDTTLEVPDGIRAAVVRLPFRKTAGAKNAATAAMAWALTRLGVLDANLIGERLAATFGSKAKRSLTAIAWGIEEARRHDD